ncbi:MAG: FecR domain-containing protein [Solimonas sp.]
MLGRNGIPSIDEQAADWVAQLDRSGLDAGQNAELERWLAADTRHFGAFARARAVFASLDRAPALGPDFDPGQYAPVAEAAPATAVDHGRRRLLVGGAMAAGLVFGTGLSVSVWRDGRYATALGEVRRVPLADGSVITLNTATRIKVAFTQTLRRIELLQGEALFDISRHAGPPLQVVIGAVSLLASGARFNVRRNGRSAMNLIVRDGIVKLHGGEAVPDMTVGANVEAQVGDDGRVTARRDIAPAQAERKLAWRDGMIAFQGETLAQAAAEFARYSDRRIVIRDASVGTRTVTGLFSATNPTGFARAIATSYALRLQVSDDMLLLSAA